MSVHVHFPGKGAGTDHTRVICREDRKRECPFKESKSTFVCVTYLCIKPEGTSSRFSPKSAILVMILFIRSGFKMVHRKQEYINVNSEIYVVYTSKRSTNKNETESRTRNQTVKGSTRDTSCIIRFFFTIMLKSKR